MKTKETKIIISGNFDKNQISALLPSFILTQENQNVESRIKSNMDFEVIDYKIKTNHLNQEEIIVYWKEK